MAKDRELSERTERVETIIERLESGDLSPEDSERLFEEGRRQLEEVREVLERGEGQIIELPE